SLVGGRPVGRLKYEAHPVASDRCSRPIQPALDEMLRTRSPVGVKCSRCGRENPDSLRFCQDCGNRLVAAVAPVAPAPVAVQAARPSDPRMVRSRPPAPEFDLSPRPEAQPVGITCARCGTNNPTGSRFCASCGTPLGAPPAQQAPAAAIAPRAVAPSPVP